jgi:hypothetical protein
MDTFNRSVVDCGQLGNTAKMREALEGVRDWLVEHNAYVDTEREIVKLNAALAEPVRNCDVGTAEEQYRRFFEECRNRRMPCLRADDYRCDECYSKWAQMPYESEVKK